MTNKIQTHRSESTSKEATQATPFTQQSHLASENDLLITSLHVTQEKLEEATIKLTAARLTIDSLKSRLERFNAKFPDYWDTESIRHSVSKNKSGMHTILWEVAGAELGNRHHRALKFETTCHNGIAGIKILNTSTEFDWFKSNPKSEALTCSPVSGSYATKNNQTISNIGASDWKALKHLVNKVNSILNTDKAPDIPEEVAMEISRGLKNLKTVLDNWPKVLRWDSIKINNSIQSAEYQAVDLSISNLEIDNRALPQFSYRLASVNEPGKAFGQHPRLEFHENTTSDFDNWFCETTDHRGKRLELRFAAPDQMDYSVWTKLSHKDQILIAANISKLPDVFKTLKTQADIDLDWEAWEKLSLMLKNILASTVNKQAHQTPKPSN